MRRYDTPYVTDWYATSVRWLMLVVLTLSLSLRGQLGDLPFWVLALMFVWNILMSVIAGLNVRLPYHRYIVLGVDFILSALFYWAQSTLAGGTSIWVGVTPIVTGAIYFEAWGALVSTVLFVGLQFFFLDFSFKSDIIFTLAVGVASGLLGRFGMTRIRAGRQKRVDAEERRRRAETERLRAIYELTSNLTATLSYKLSVISACSTRYWTWDITH